MQRLGDELFCVQGAVADQCVELPLAPDGGYVLVVILDLADEELVQLERDQLGASERAAFREQLVEVAGHHLGGPFVGEPRHAQSVEPGAVRRPRVPPHIMASPHELHRDPGQRVEMTICGHRREEDLHPAATSH